MVFGPIGGRIEIQGLQSFRAAKNEVVNGFNQIGRSVKSVGAATLPSLTGGARGGLYTGGRIGGIGVYQRLPVQLGLVGVAAGAAIAVVEKLGATFDKTTNSVRVFGNATESQTQAISKASIQMSRSFVSSANDISKGAIALGKAGAPVADLNNNLLKSTVIFNQASEGEVSTAEASDLLVQSVQALNLTYADSTKLVDTYVGAVQNSTLTFGDLTTQLKTTLPIAGALNITAEELATTLALLSQNGLRGSIAGTTLKNALLAIADPSKEALEILQKYNISLFDSTGKALPLIEVLGRLEKAFGSTNEGITDAQKFFEQSDIFNTRQILAALALVNQGTDGFNRMQAAIRNTSSTQIAADLQNNVIDQLKIVGNNLQANALIAANEFQPTIVRALKVINDELRNLGVDGFREFGREVNSVLSFTNEDFNQFLVNVAGVAGGVEEATVIIREQLQTWRLDVDTNIEGINTTLLTLPQTTKNATRETRTELIKLQEEFNKTSGNLGIVLEQLATHIVFFGKITGSVAGDAVKVTGSVANETHRQVGIIDAAVAQMIAILGRPVVAINFLLEQIAKLTGTTIPRADLFPGPDFLMEESKKEVKEGVKEVGNFITGVTENVLTSIAAGYDATAQVIDKTSDRIEAATKRAEDAQRARNTSIARRLLPDMPNDMGFWDRIGGGVLPAVTPRVGGGGSTFPSAGGGGGASAEDVDKLAARIREMLRDVPALTGELTEFIAGIAKDFPERLQPMVSALKASRGEIGQLVLLKRDMLQTDLQLIGVEQNLSRLEAESGRIEIQQAIVVLGFEKQLLDLRHQLLQLDQQMVPLRERLLVVDREMSRLQQTNLTLNRDRINAELEALPIRKQIRDIEERITKSVDKRAAIQRSIKALDRADIEDTLATAEDQLAIAWENLDVSTILKLEKEIQGIEKTLKEFGKDDDKAARAEERKRLGLELEKIALEEQLEPIEKRITLINDQLTLEQLRNELAITFLEEERRKIIELLQPLEDEQRAIGRVIAEIEFLRAAAVLEFEERKIGIQEMILNEKLRQAELLETKRQQNELFTELVLGFVTSLAASEAFTLDEALEVAQRLRLWNDQIAKLAETVVEFQRLDQAADDAAAAIRAIPKDVTVTITTVHRTVFETGGAPSAEGVPQFASGGVVPGKHGQPLLAIVHGGEVINSVTNNRVPESVKAREASMLNRGTINYITEHNYNVSPHYQEVQSPASLRDDMRALIMMATH